MPFKFPPSPQNGDRQPVTVNRDVVREGNVWKQRTADPVFNSSFYPPPESIAVEQPVFARPADWLPLPVIGESEEKITILHAVWAEPTPVSFRCGDAYTVDWGDGTVENFGAYSDAKHIYDFATHDVAGDTLTAQGYKQAVITITPQAGGHLQYATFSIRYGAPRYYNVYSSGFLDIHIHSSYLQDLTLSRNWSRGVTDGEVTHSYLRHATISKSNLKFANGIFRNCAALEKVSALSFSSTPSREVSVSYDTATGELTFSEPHGLRAGDPFTIAEAADPLNLSMLGTTYYVYNVLSATRISLINSAYSVTTLPVLSQTPTTDFTVALGVDVGGLFFGCNGLKEVAAFDMSNAVNAADMFTNCYTLKQLPMLDMSKLVDSSQMFGWCYSLQTIPTYDFKNVVSANNMFINSGIRELPVLDFRRARFTASMFQTVRALTHMPQIRLDSTVSCISMFSGCTALQYVEDMVLPKVDAVTSMFSTCRSLKIAPKILMPLVTTASNMFSACSVLTIVPDYDTPELLTVTTMFSNCQRLAKAPMLTFGKVTVAQSMFNNCNAMLEIPFYDTGNVANANGMFANCISLKEIPALDFTNVATANSMFSGCFSMEALPVSSFPALTSAANMFWGCSTLSAIDGVSFPLLTTATAMFQNCYELRTALNLNFPVMASLDGLFHTCKALELVSFQQLGTVTAAANAFNGCVGLRSVSGFNLNNATDGSNVFTGCGSLSRVINFSVKPGGINLSFGSTKLEASGIEEIFTSLPSGASGKTVSITNCPGAATADKWIALNKGWSVSS